MFLCSPSEFLLLVPAISSSLFFTVASPTREECLIVIAYQLTHSVVPTYQKSGTDSFLQLVNLKSESGNYIGIIQFWHLQLSSEESDLANLKSPHGVVWERERGTDVPNHLVCHIWGNSHSWFASHSIPCVHILGIFFIELIVANRLKPRKKSGSFYGFPRLQSLSLTVN